MIQRVSISGAKRVLTYSDSSTLPLEREEYAGRLLFFPHAGGHLEVVRGGSHQTTSGGYILADGFYRELKAGQLASYGKDGRIWVDGICFVSINRPREEAMAEKQGVPEESTWSQAKKDSEDAAMRLAGKQFVKLTSDPLVAAISRGLGDDTDATRAKVARFLGTELGQAILKGILSMGLQMLPEGMGPMPKKLARELRVQGMEGAGDVVADIFMKPLREVMSTFAGGGSSHEPLGLPAERPGMVRPPEASEAGSAVAAEYELPLGRTGTDGR